MPLQNSLIFSSSYTDHTNRFIIPRFLHNGTIFRISLPLRNRRTEAIPSTEPVAETPQRNPSHNGTIFRISLPLRKRGKEAIPSTEPVAEASQRNPSHNGTVSRISLPLRKQRRRKEDKCEQNIC